MYVPTGLFSLVLLTVALGAQALTPSHHLSLSDVARLQALLSQPFTDLASAYYSIVGLSKLGASVADENVSKWATKYWSKGAWLEYPKHVAYDMFALVLSLHLCYSRPQCFPLQKKSKGDTSILLPHQILVFPFAGCLSFLEGPTGPHECRLPLLCCWGQSGHLRLWGRYLYWVLDFKLTKHVICSSIKMNRRTTFVCAFGCSASEFFTNSLVLLTSLFILF